MPKPAAYTCNICHTELRAADGKTAYERAKECEALGRPPFGYKVGDQIPYVRIMPMSGGRRVERTLTITLRYYVRQTHLVRRGKPKERKVVAHVPAYEFEYVDDRGRQHKAWCTETRLDEFKAGPVKGFRGRVVIL